MTASVALRVRVVDRGGTPLEWARVYFVSAPVPVPEVAALTDPLGVATLAAPASGRYVVGAQAEGLEAATAAVEVEGEEVSIELQLV